jgi:hypothetical protein
LERGGFHRTALSFSELVEKLRELLTEAEKLGAQRYLALRTRLGRAAALMAPEVANAFASPRNGVALILEQLTNEHRELDITTAVLAVGPPCLLRPECRELRLPVTKRMWLDADDIRDLSDLEEELIRKLGAS